MNEERQTLTNALADHFQPRPDDEVQVQQVMAQVRRRPAPAAQSLAALWVLVAMAAAVLLVLGVLGPAEQQDMRPNADDELLARFRDLPTDDPSSHSSAGAEESEPADGWGHLTGRFVFDGEPPARERLRFSAKAKDVALCGKHELLDESLVVDPKTRGVANVFVYLSSRPPRVHPELARVANESVMLDNQQCRFVPHASIVHVGQTLRLGNSDPVLHNSQLNPRGDTPCNPLIPSQREVEYTFQRQQNQPVRVACSLHPWMSAWVLPRQSPYATVSDQTGRFVIANLPAGTHQIQLWHERPGALNARDNWNQGRVTVTIRAGQQTDLGEVLLSPELLRVADLKPREIDAPGGCCPPRDK